MATLAALAADIPVVGVFHQPELAARYCSRLIAIQAGAVIYDGPPALDLELLDEIYGTEREQVVSHGGPDSSPSTRADQVCT